MWRIEVEFEYCEFNGEEYPRWHRVKRFVSRHKTELDAISESAVLPAVLCNGNRLKYCIINEKTGEMIHDGDCIDEITEGDPE